MKRLCKPQAALLLTIAFLCGGCAASSKTAVEKTAAGQPVEMKRAPLENPMECPSLDFTEFLKMYMDADSDTIRLSFTDESVEYLVPFYIVQEPNASSPDMHVSKLRGPDRFRNFPVRYFKAGDGYYSVDQSGALESGADLGSKQGRYPLKVEIGKGEDREAIFGLEYEVDIYRFAYRNSCWYLTQIINPRD
ncbi:MAG TPA: hypothetical protein VEY92_07500 [Pseudoxanthomonas sp.]|nr:hypothetical protein [Pseudoxanthomonas sp.]